VRAVLELRERARTLLRDGASLQIGVGAGLCVVQPARRGERRYAVAGAPLELASFLASHAGGGAVLLTPDAQRLAHPFFDTAPACPVSVPDRAEPMVPHRVVGASGHATRLEAAGELGLTAFSGRSAELAFLRAALQRARGGRGQMVTVMGEAGVGKSRLLHEFVQGLESDVRVIRGRCPAQNNALPYHPFTEALRDTLGVGVTPAHALDPHAVAGRVMDLSPELEEFLPLYLHLLGISSERHSIPPHLRGGTLRPAIREALSAAFTLAASAAPVALVLEDWHWADAASHEALLQIAEVALECPLLVSVSYRPGHEVVWPEATAHAALRLGPLDVAASISVIASVLGADALSDEFAATIHERAGGNPFFIEELCHTLSEQGLLHVVDGRVEPRGSLDDLHLPGTVQGVIRTRLDRLDPDTKEVVRVAAVVGREFAVPVVERVLAPEGLSPESALLRLTELGLVQRVRVVPDPTYRFKHVLTQQVAYDTLLLHQRRALHGRVGAAIEARWPDRCEQHAEALAHHFHRAGDWRKAVRYARDAASRARHLSDFTPALAILDRVEQWADELHEDERGPVLVEVLLEQERLCETLGLRGRQQELIGRLILLLENAGDPRRLAEAYRRQGDVHTLLTRYDEAETALARALALDREVGNEVGERSTLTSLGLLCWHQGRNHEGLAYIESALVIDRRRGNAVDIVHDLANVGPILKDLGEYERAAASLQEALEIAEENGNPMTAAHAMHNLANVYRMMGEPDRALALVSRSVQVSHSSRLPLESSFTLTTLAHLQLDRGLIEESLDTYRRAVEVGRRVGHADGLCQSLRFLGEVLAGLGRTEEGLPYLDEAAELFARLANGHAEGGVRARIARIHEAAGRTNAARDQWRRVHALSRAFGYGEVELDACLGLMRSAESDDDLTGARGALEDGIALARRLGEEEKEAGLHNAAGIVAWRRDAVEEALAHYQQALSLFRELEHASGVGLALNSLGVTLIRQGRAEEGRARLEEALAHNRAAGERLLEGHALSALGDVHLARGAHAAAERCYRESLTIRQDLADRAGEGWMEQRLGEVARAAGEHGAAERRRARAARIAEQTGNPELLRACAARVEPVR
jgi:predicted ATPase